MINLTDEDVAEVQRIWKEEFREVITVAYARERATELLRVYILLAGGPADQV